MISKRLVNKYLSRIQLLSAKQYDRFYSTKQTQKIALPGTGKVVVTGKMSSSALLQRSAKSGEVKKKQDPDCIIINRVQLFLRTA